MSQKKLKILGISGARSGSKGLSHKNVKKLGGKPLLVWPAEIAKKSKYINRYILSTDSPDYARLANRYSIETPFIQPLTISTDHSTVFEFIEHALVWLEREESYVPDLVVYLCPTTPLVLAQDVDRGIELILKNQHLDSVVLISPAKGHPRKMVKLSEKQGVLCYVTNQARDVAPSNRQAYEIAYNRESLPVITRVGVIKNKRNQTGDFVGHHLISADHAHDIDNELDFFIAQQLLKKLNKK